MPLLESEKKALLAIARMAIEGYLKERRIPEFDVKSPALLEKRGAFVTLRRGENLRGCIGVFSPDKPLSQTVSEMAVSAAIRDPRFSPVTTEELLELTVEVSALTPLRRISGVKEIEVGRHGIYIIKGRHSGVLLPQVATECGFDRDTFLDQTCRKAGLTAGCWRSGAEIYVFEAEIFSEGNFL